MAVNIVLKNVSASKGPGNTIAECLSRFSTARHPGHHGIMELAQHLNKFGGAAMLADRTRGFCEVNKGCIEFVILFLTLFLKLVPSKNYVNNPTDFCRRHTLRLAASPAPDEGIFPVTESCKIPQWLRHT